MHSLQKEIDSQLNGSYQIVIDLNWRVKKIWDISMLFVLSVDIEVCAKEIHRSDFSCTFTSPVLWSNPSKCSNNMCALCVATLLMYYICLKRKSDDSWIKVESKEYTKSFDRQSNRLSRVLRMLDSILICRPLGVFSLSSNASFYKRFGNCKMCSKSLIIIFWFAILLV